MTPLFEELDFQKTPLGDISLRRRSDPQLDGRVLYEVKLNDEFLMSSLFTEAEIQLSRLGLALLEGTGWDIVVGGLGLGYTAAAVLENPSVRTLAVIEVMGSVIGWHQRGLAPLGKILTTDPRCHLIQADFFEWATSAAGYDRTIPSQLAHALLLDIDHSPRNWLNPANRSFYTPAGIERMANKLHPGGVFAMWSNDPPDADFRRLLETVFQVCEPHVISFLNPYSEGELSNTVYIARKAH